MSGQVEENQNNSVPLLHERPRSNGNIAPEDFDWVAYESGLSSEEKEEHERLKKVYTETIPDIQELNIYKGIVTRITDKEVIVDIGFKAECVISSNEFRGTPDLKVGGIIEAMVSKRDYKGQCILSYHKAKMFRNWERINQAYENGEVLIGYVVARTKGGLIVVVLDIECFLPGSHINVKPIKDYDLYVGKTLEVKIVKINPSTKNVVVSHKVLIERDIEEQRMELVAKLEKGQVVEGRVKNITPYGAFVDLGGVDALLHITDMSWRRIEHPSEVVELDQIVKLVVLGIDREKSRVQLGMKQLQPHPWISLNPDLKVGDRIKGIVSVLTDYGAFIEIHPGVEGLIHVSEMSWSSDLQSAQDFVQVGDEIEAVILVLDRDERKLSLSIKQFTPDPWIDIEAKYPVGSKQKGIVHSFTNFGVFVELEPGVRGLVYTPDLSWDKKIKHSSEFCNKGDQMETIVLGLDVKIHRLHLGHKQLTENPLEKYEQIYAIGSIHHGTVIDIFDKGAIVQFEDQKIEAFAPARYLERQNNTRIKKGEQTDFKVIEFNKDVSRVVVSHTATFRDKEQKQIDEHMKRQRVEISTLGGELDELIQLKNQMERDSKKKSEK
ncbi:MAG: 30S ribosomal protein S1 [Flavobacteriales bacterium AspAUS03]